MKLYRLYDTKALAWSDTFPGLNDTEVCRQIGLLATNPQSKLYAHANDFELVEVGVEDAESGVIHAHATPRAVESVMVCRAQYEAALAAAEGRHGKAEDGS